MRGKIKQQKCNSEAYLSTSFADAASSSLPSSPPASTSRSFVHSLISPFMVPNVMCEEVEIELSDKHLRMHTRDVGSWLFVGVN